MYRFTQPKLRKLFLGVLVAAASSTQIATAGGLGLFSHSACDSGCATECCDSGACGDSLCCDSAGCSGLGCDGCDACSLTCCDAGLLSGLIKPSDR
ncbi:MAG: hypothetical protein KDB00_18160 [Planctomycetales bacterium]|nr:hypothetical protein [Planctomycetales bacterium]